jgi:aminocarboxymuconate-semialdehyde decarboxylase
MAIGGDVFSDIAFLGCNLLAAAAAVAAPVRPQAKRREVAVAGKRVRTVDIHAHCGVPEAMKMMGMEIQPALVMADKTARLKAMDQQGIDIEALSINPYWYGATRDVAEPLIKLQNEKLAEIRDAEPERFTTFATIALQFPELAAQQLDHAVKKLGFRGVSVGGSVNGEELANPKFNPFWAKCEELNALVFLHPQGTKELESAGRLKGSGLLENTIGNPLETTIALSHLIFEGTLDRYPGLKICAAHGGGYLPSYAARSDAVCKCFPDRVGPLPKRPPTAYLRQLYFDTIVFTPEALRHLTHECGAGQIMMGTDYPYPWTSTSVDHILSTPDLSDADKIAMLGGTAQKLMGLK